MALRDRSSGETNVQDREALVCAGNFHSKRTFVRLGFPGTRHRTDSPQRAVDIQWLFMLLPLLSFSTYCGLLESVTAMASAYLKCSPPNG